MCHVSHIQKINWVKTIILMSLQDKKNIICFKRVLRMEIIWHILLFIKRTAGFCLSLQHLIFDETIGSLTSALLKIYSPIANRLLVYVLFLR